LGDWSCRSASGLSRWSPTTRASSARRCANPTLTAVSEANAAIIRTRQK
jgi:hypothetical protein